VRTCRFRVVLAVDTTDVRGQTHHCNPLVLAHTEDYIRDDMRFNAASLFSKLQMADLSFSFVEITVVVKWLAILRQPDNHEHLASLIVKAVLQIICGLDRQVCLHFFRTVRNVSTQPYTQCQVTEWMRF